ncbi:TAXI family TRAP transporter solute-binding subunit [Virgibacillus dakarensis]|uniref:TAXI family TRAP transporter solute-binding subunit n=1 Tax=Virgibacillus dakarensis TaxID=1917889 RepID=UPI000B42D181|nr:TAXI family TRAP transporter solute-binding subunit [Virgibacillus dakarensis]MBT2214751.1 TAXI family TRAP transporter solute-binding subunit [Virgibacillus dakarensis]MTW85577.1 TAXI family TRAP transporter solute-binding subunit [Virgibacillus dakarensis]
MKKRTLFLFIIVLAVGMVLTACGESGKGSGGSSSDGGSKKEAKTNLTLGTGSVGGVYYPLGGEMATLWKNNIDVDGFDVSSVEAGGSVDNIAKIQAGDYQLGIAQNTTLISAVNQTGDFEGKEMDDVVVLASLYPEAVQVATTESTGIESIADLKGKKIAVGPPGGATREAAELVLKAYGIEDGDYEAYEEGFGDAKGKLQNGTIDASIEVVGVPSSSTDELQASTKEVKLLNIEGDALQEVVDNSEYEAYTVEPGTYEWLDEPVQTVTAMALLVGSKSQISEDLAYDITKTLVEKSGDMSIAQAKLITKDNILTGVGNLPIHPGAQKYFDEAGIE